MDRSYLDAGSPQRDAAGGWTGNVDDGSQPPLGVWATLDHDPGSSYRVRVERGGITHEQHDPWAFRSEWMGDMDRHLFAQGNHHHIWQRMGAHLTEQDGVAGVMFCLWAPMP